MTYLNLNSKKGHFKNKQNSFIYRFEMLKIKFKKGQFTHY